MTSVELKHPKIADGAAALLRKIDTTNALSRAFVVATAKFRRKPFRIGFSNLAGGLDRSGCPVCHENCCESPYRAIRRFSGSFDI